MDTTAYLNYQMRIFEKCTDNFIYDDIGANFAFTNDSISKQANEFLEYYAYILGDKNIYVPSLSENDLFQTSQGQKLYEIIKCCPKYQRKFNNKKINKENIYDFLVEEINSICAPDETTKKESVKKWFGARQSKPKERKSIFLISFALNLPIEPSSETPNFCHKHLFNKVFCERYALRTPDELCYMYAKYNNMSYLDAVDMYQTFLTQINKQHIFSNNATKSNNTINILSEIKDISKDMFINLLVEYYPHLDINHTSVLNRIQKYKEEVEKEDFIKKIIYKRENIFSPVLFDKHQSVTTKKETMRTDVDLTKRLTNYIMFGSSNVNDSRSKLHKAFDFVLRSRDINAKPNGSSDSKFYEKTRKTLIYFHFLSFWNNTEEDYTPCYENYIDEINDLLIQYMLPPLYPFNKSDLFFIFCGKSNDPISTFFILLSKMDDIIDEEI